MVFSRLPKIYHFYDNIDNFHDDNNNDNNNNNNNNNKVNNDIDNIQTDLEDSESFTMSIVPNKSSKYTELKQSK